MVFLKTLFQSRHNKDKRDDVDVSGTRQKAASFRIKLVSCSLWKSFEDFFCHDRLNSGFMFGWPGGPFLSTCWMFDI